MNKLKKAKIIIAIISISFIQGLQYSVSPVLDQIQEHYPEVSRSLIQMLITQPAFLAMIVALFSGWLVVKVSKKRLLVFGAFVAGVTGFLPFLADDFRLLMLSRTLYGIGLGIATALNTAIVADFFEGDERVSVMGIQAASIGAGMVVVATLSGILGSYGYEFVYYTHIIGCVSMMLVAGFLPETGKAMLIKTEKIHLTKEVFIVSLLGAIEFMFLITFTTNIAMHISGTLTGNTSVSGTLTGIFSATQIVIGMTLGLITKVTKKYTLPIAMLCFSVGGLILVCFPSSYLLLMLGAVFCGFSQGVFVPRAMVDVANAVKPVATAMAAAVFTCAICVGQLISPTVLNTASKLIFGDITTTYVYLISTVTMTIVAMLLILIQLRKQYH